MEQVALLPSFINKAQFVTHGTLFVALLIRGQAGFMRYIKYSYDKESQRVGTDFTKVEPA